MKLFITTLFSCLLVPALFAQNVGEVCGSSHIIRKNYAANPARQQLMEKLDLDLAQQIQTHSNASNKMQASYTLPVVVHIIHYPGTPIGTNENLAVGTINNAILWLNQAFSNTGYYDPTTGVDTDIQFCLAAQTPDGLPTTGINRVGSWNTDMIMETQDTLVKNLVRWDPTRYINVWVVNSVTSSSSGPGVVGYAYFPNEHGSVIDGIMMESSFFGVHEYGTAIFVHEMGHYLGLYHTFEGGCTNNNCLLDGDHVCDTPPDQSTTWVSCSATVNTCSTDANSGFASDQNDMISNYMDYSDPTCYSVFTANQSTRMISFINGARLSLLSSPACSPPPCASPVDALFTASTTTVNVGGSVTFTNTSTGGVSYNWLVDGVSFSTATNSAYTFNAVGIHQIKLVASNGATCLDSMAIDVNVLCPVNASFSSTPLNITPGGTVSFTNTSTGSPTTNQWYVDFVQVATTTNYSQVFPNPGQYQVYLISSIPQCSDISQIVIVTVGNDCSTVSAGPNSAICPGDSAQLMGSVGATIPGPVITWAGAGQFIPNRHVKDPQYIPSAAEVAAGFADVEMQVEYPVVDNSVAPRLLGYGHNGEDEIYFINPSSGAFTIPIPDNDNLDCLAMGYDIDSDVLYAVGMYSPNHGLYRWDNVSTAPVRTTVNTGYPVRMTAGDYDNVHEIFYTIGTTWGTNMPQSLYRINTTTGAATLVGNLGILSTFPSYTSGADGIGGLAYDPTQDVLYGVTSLDKLFRISTTTGAATLVDTLSTTGLSLRGLTYDFNRHKLWGLAGTSELYEIDKFTAQILSINTNSAPTPGIGLTYAPATLVDPIMATCYDTVRITIHPQPQMNLGADATACSNTLPEILSPDLSPFVSWNWQDGSTTSTYNATTNGVYWIEGTDANGCKDRDSVNVNVIPFSGPYPNLGPDIATCAGQALTLDPGPGFTSYLWHNLATTQTNTVFGAGTYYVHCTNACGDVYSDTIVVSIDPASIISLTNPAPMCLNDSATLVAPSGYSAYQWHPLVYASCSNCPNPKVSPPADQTYTLVVTTASGCVSTASLLVEILPCILPVNFLSFTGTIVEDRNKLEWVTAQAQNVQSYNLYRLEADGSETLIEELAPNATQKYVAYDYEPQAISRYKVYARDLDGTSTGSNVVLLSRNASEWTFLGLCPNPSVNNFDLSWLSPNEQTLSLKIMNALGQEVHTSELQGQLGSNTYHYESSNLASGVYFVQLEQQGQIIFTQKWIKE